jgi:hypothetical protein
MIFASDIPIHQKTSDWLNEVFYGVSGGENQGIMALDFALPIIHLNAQFFLNFSMLIGLNLVPFTSDPFSYLQHRWLLTADGMNQYRQFLSIRDMVPLNQIMPSFFVYTPPSNRI